MAPVTALLSQGFQPETFGEKAESLQAIPMPRPSAAPDGLTGHVIHVDSFGNIITDIRRHDLPNDNVRINIGGHTVIGLNRNYVAGQGLLTLIGSTGYLEIALNNGSAAAITGARIGDEIKVRTGA
jgi:S-adenosylmethionine hydrolase